MKEADIGSNPTTMSKRKQMFLDEIILVIPSSADGVGEACVWSRSGV